MPNFAKAASIFLVPLTLAIGGVASDGTASAQTAQPCSGTLCDLYYGGKGPAPAVSSATSPSATQPGVPLTVPSTNIFSGLFSGGDTQAAPSGATPTGASQPASTPFVRVVGGRPANEPCTGTLCDLYHSGDPSPSQETVERQAGAAPSVETVAARAPARKFVPAPQPEPICRNDRDPWQCYR